MGVIQRQGIKNTFISYFGILLGFASLIVIQPLLLKPEEIGLMRVMVNFSSMVAVFIPLGIGSILNKFFPLFRNQHKGHNGALGLVFIFLLVGFAFVGTLLLLSGSFITNQYRKESALFVNYFYWVIPIAGLMAVSSALNVFCNSLFKSTIPNFLNDVLIRVVTIVSILVYHFKLIGLDGFVLCIVLTYLLQAILLIIYLFRVGRPGLRINWHLVKINNPRLMLGYGFLFVFVAASTLGLKFVDTIIMAKFLPLELVGIYSIAAFIPTVMEAPLNALDRISTSKLAQALVDKNHEHIEEIYYKSVRFLLLIGALLFVNINTNIRFLVQMLPAKFHGGTEVVYIYSLGTLITISGGLSGPIIFLSDNFFKGAMLLIGMLVFTISANFLLIPKLGMNGAALSITLTAILSTALRFLILWRNFKLQPYNRITFYNLILVLACFTINYFLPVLSSPLGNIVMRGILFSTVYLGCAYLLNMAPELFEIAINLMKKLKT